MGTVAVLAREGSEGEGTRKWSFGELGRSNTLGHGTSILDTLFLTSHTCNLQGFQWRPLARNEVSNVMMSFNTCTLCLKYGDMAWYFH